MHIKIFIKAFLVLLLLRTASLQAAGVDDSRALFQSRCASCHMIDQRLVGPALKDVYKSQSEDWIISFVHSPTKKIHCGDTAAANLYQRFQPIMMPDQTDLSDDQIKGLITYIKEESKKLAPVMANVSATAMPVDGTITWSNYWFWDGVLTLIAFLLYGLIILIRAFRAKQEYLLTRNK